MTIETILVPTDGSEGATTGARRSIEIAAAVGAAVHVLSVINTDELEPELQDAGGDSQEAILREHAEQSVETIASMARSHLDGEVIATVEAGNPAETINDYVDRHGIDLVGMGTQGRTGLQRIVLGSVSEKTLRSARVPVLTTTPGAAVDAIGETRYDDVLLPTDGSDAAERAVEWGVGFAGDLDARVHTLYSVDPGRFGDLEGAAAIHDALEAAAEMALDRVRELARAEDVSVEASLSGGPAARSILNYIEEHDVELVVMGTHGRGGLSRYLIGSVTETVVRNADVPVCSVPMR